MKRSYFLISVSNRRNLDLCIKYGLAGFTNSISGVWTFAEIQNNLRVRIQTDRQLGADGGTFYIYETWAAVTFDSPPNVTLNYPIQNYYNDTSDPINVTFNCSMGDSLCW